jgi:transcriptional regulator with XRE-family HTH domain
LFAARLTELLEKAKNEGRDQKQVAEDLGISEQVLSNYKLGKRQPDHEIINKIADYFGITDDDLLGRIDDPAKVVIKGKEMTIDAENLDDEEIQFVKEWVDLRSKKRG